MYIVEVVALSVPYGVADSCHTQNKDCTCGGDFEECTVVAHNHLRDLLQAKSSMLESCTPSMLLVGLGHRRIGSLYYRAKTVGGMPIDMCSVEYEMLDATIRDELIVEVVHGVHHEIRKNQIVDCLVLTLPVVFDTLHQSSSFPILSSFEDCCWHCSASQLS